MIKVIVNVGKHMMKYIPYIPHGNGVKMKAKVTHDLSGDFMEPGGSMCKHTI